MTTPTAEFVKRLESLKAGDFGRLRKHAGQSLDESVDGFDLFAGLWWPLRAGNERAPRREVAWLVTKLYAICPMPQADGETLASQLARMEPREERARKQYRQRFDSLLFLPLSQIEPALRTAITAVASSGGTLDWVRLTDQLSLWEREETRSKWAREFLRLSY